MRQTKYSLQKKKNLQAMSPLGGGGRTVAESEGNLHWRGTSLPIFFFCAECSSGISQSPSPLSQIGGLEPNFVIMMCPNPRGSTALALAKQAHFQEA